MQTTVRRSSEDAIRPPQAGRAALLITPGGTLRSRSRGSWLARLVHEGQAKVVAAQQLVRLDDAVQLFPAPRASSNDGDPVYEHFKPARIDSLDPRMHYSTTRPGLASCTSATSECTS